MTLHLRSDCDLCRRYAPDPPQHSLPVWIGRTKDETIGLTIDELMGDPEEKEKKE